MSASCDRCLETALTILTDMGENVCVPCLVGASTPYLILGLTPTDEVKS